MKTVTIGNFELFNSGRPFIIAEIGQAHDGSLGLAHSYIDAVAKAGADAVKFQTHIASEESTYDEPFRIEFSKQDKTRYDYWERMQFTEDQWRGLAKHAGEKGLMFLSSAFSVKAINILDKIEMPAWKIGSGEFWSSELLDAMMRTGKPLLISTGMNSWKEIDEMVDKMQKCNYPFLLFQCTSKYPTGLSEVGINIISEMQEKYGCPVGLSDHSGSLYPSLASMAKGVALLEVHVTFSKEMFGPDTSSSISLEELSTLVDARDSFFEMYQNPVDKDDLAENLSATRSLFSKSIALNKGLVAGSIVSEDDICTKKPGTGISIDKKYEVIGRRLINDITSDRLLKWEDLE